MSDSICFYNRLMEFLNDFELIHLESLNMPPKAIASDECVIGKSLNKHIFYIETTFDFVVAKYKDAVHILNSMPDYKKFLIMPNGDCYTTPTGAFASQHYYLAIDQPPDYNRMIFDYVIEKKTEDLNYRDVKHLIFILKNCLRIPRFISYKILLFYFKADFADYRKYICGICDKTVMRNGKCSRCKKCTACGIIVSRWLHCYKCKSYYCEDDFYYNSDYCKYC